MGLDNCSESPFIIVMQKAMKVRAEPQSARKPVADPIETKIKIDENSVDLSGKHIYLVVYRIVIILYY